MKKKDLEAFASEAATTLKTLKDFSGFRAMLTKMAVAWAHNAELDDHLGDAQSDLRGRRVCAPISKVTDAVIDEVIE
jgi:hypothetical protein